MKRVTPAARAGHDRWLVSYADLVTLLFAFFTTLYAASVVKATGEPESLPKPGVSIDPVVHAVTDRTARAITTPVVETLRSELASKLEDDVRLQRADIVSDDRGVVVSLPERATFAVASAEVTDAARPLIAKVIAALGDRPYALRIEGHTDDVPIQTARYRSNWELSTARAGAVVAFMIGELHVAPERLSAAGYAEFHPRVPNDSPANRAKNRRIDIVVTQGGSEASIGVTE